MQDWGWYGYLFSSVFIIIPILPFARVYFWFNFPKTLILELCVLFLIIAWAWTIIYLLTFYWCQGCQDSRSLQEFPLEVPRVPCLFPFRHLWLRGEMGIMTDTTIISCISLYGETNSGGDQGIYLSTHSSIKPCE